MSAERQDLYRYVVEEFAEDYREGEMDRREFLRRTVLLGSGVSGARTLLASLGIVGISASELAQAAKARPEAAVPLAQVTVDPKDPSIQVEDLKFTARGFENLAYLARPSTLEAAPGVLVIHENRGLQEHIKDVARRLAKEGFVALAPDLVSKAGGTNKYTDTAQISTFLAQTPPEEHIANLQTALNLLRNTKGVRADRLGVVGFCFGGGLTWRLSTEAPDLKAAVPFYGPAPDLDKVANIKAAVLAVYGGNDARINAGIPALEAALKKAGVTYEIRIYDGANHAFHNDTGANYDKNAAQDAWKRTIAHFRAHLS